MPLARLSAKLLPVFGMDYAGGPLVKEFTSPSGPPTGLAGYSLEGQRKRPAAARILARLRAKRVDLNKAVTDHEAHQASTSPFNLKPVPTDGQARAGNYPKGHLRVAGLDVSVENPAGSSRRPEWPPLSAHYGYVRRTEGADGDQVDVFVRVGTPEDFAGPAFVIDQVRPSSGIFDEHKVMLGWHDEDGARRAYLSNYEPGWKGIGAVTEMPMIQFKRWLRGDTTQPVALGKGVPVGRDGARLIAVTPTHF